RRTFFLTSRILSPMFFPYSLLMIVTQILRSALGLLLYVAGTLRVPSAVKRGFKPTPRALAVLADQHLVSGYQRDGIELWAVVYPLLYFTMCGLLFWYGAAIGGSPWAGLKPL